MKKLLFALSFTILLFGSCGDKQESMSDLINDRIQRSIEQSTLMAESLINEPAKLPKTIDKEGNLVTSNSRWWCSGFFPGTLWYLYEYSKDNQLLDYAKNYTARIEGQKYTKGTHDLGFMLYCSFGNGYRLTGDTAYKSVLFTGAESLASRYNPVVGCIKSWDWKNKHNWQFPVIIDNMMNLEFLMWVSEASGNPFYKEVSVSHSDVTMKHHFRPDYSCYHVISYDTITGQPEKKNTHQGYADESAWARGQAWALYGYTMMYRMSKKEAYLEQANHIANFILTHKNLPEDKIPYWDFDAPEIPEAKRDASAGAVIASALIELSQYVDAAKSKEYLSVAETQLRTLSSPEYFAEKGTNGNFILKHSVGSIPGNSEVDVPLTYADYYYIEALLRWKNLK